MRRSLNPFYYRNRSWGGVKNEKSLYALRIKGTKKICILILCKYAHLYRTRTNLDIIYNIKYNNDMRLSILAQ